MNTATETRRPASILEKTYANLMGAKTSSGTQDQVVLIAGGGALAERLTERIEQAPELNFRIAGIFDDRENNRLPEKLCQRKIGKLDDLAIFARKCAADIIYITLPISSHPRLLELVEQLRDTTCSIYFVPDILPFAPIQSRQTTVAGLPVIAICETPHFGVNGALKRATDLILGSILLCVLGPLMLAIALAVRLESPGPALFRQHRYGLDGREILIYKFRSMSVQEDAREIRQATRNDSRVTRLGGLLRTTSLDELPQLINVLQGRMSLVGPRPHAIAHNEFYRQQISGYMLRHKVRPGITGWAQINGLRGETRDIEQMQARLRYDLEYLRNWSLWLDIKILLKTPGIVWKRENAY